MKRATLLYFIIFTFACGESVDKHHSFDKELPSINQTKELLVTTKLGDPIDDIDEHFKFLDLIPLITPEDITISEITNVKLDELGIYIHDKKFSSLHHFDSFGNYQKSFGSIGEGPGEYMDIADFEVVDNKISILSKSKKGILFFDKTTGDFIDEYRYDIFGDEIVHLGNNEFLIYTNFNVNDENGSFNVFRTDSKGNIIEKYFPFNEDKQHSMISMSGYLSESNNEIFFALPFDQFVFSYNRNENIFFPKYMTDMLSDYILKNKKDFDAILKPEVLVKSFGGESWNGTTFLENDKHIYLSLYDLSSQKNVVIDKETNEMITISKKSKNPLFRLLDDPLILTSKNELFFPIYGEKIYSKEYFEFSENSQFIRELMRKRDFNDADVSYFLLKTRLL